MYLTDHSLAYTVAKSSGSILDVDRHQPIDASAPQATAKGGDTSLLLDIKDTGRFLGLSPWQVRALISDGSLMIVKVGRKFYFRRTTLVRWAERAEERAA